jgi:cytoskeletal protein CcmA (bactofilin family)
LLQKVWRSAEGRSATENDSLEGDVVWKKDDEQAQRPTPASAQTAPARPEAARQTPARSGFATIGPSIVIRGEVTGDEDLLIQGQVDGSVTLGLHAVTIGDGGRVKAGITGRVITVEGAVEGDLKAEEQIVLRGSARVKGDLTAPRVVLEDGASFRGLVDMGKTPELELSPEPSRSGQEHEKETKEAVPSGRTSPPKPSIPASPPHGK